MKTFIFTIKNYKINADTKKEAENILATDDNVRDDFISDAECKKEESFLTKCKKCGCEIFWLDESLGYRATVNKKTGVLETYSCKYNEIDRISCNDCGEEYPQTDFADIEFCD